jgi:hypothetical protein
MHMNLSESVLHFVKEHHVRPARAQSQSIIEVRAGEIHTGLRWTRRVPLVCAALNSRKFQRAAGLQLIEKSGPPSGQSTTMVFRYRVVPSTETESDSRGTKSGNSKGGLLALYGMCADMYRKVGGAEAFIRSQRKDFGSIVPEFPRQAEGKNE